MLCYEDISSDAILAPSDWIYEVDVPDSSGLLGIHLLAFLRKKLVLEIIEYGLFWSKRSPLYRSPGGL
jgi:hypothetical protein